MVRAVERYIQWHFAENDRLNLEDWAVSGDAWRRRKWQKLGSPTLNDFWYAPDTRWAEAALATGLRTQLATEILDVDKNL